MKKNTLCLWYDRDAESAAQDAIAAILEMRVGLRPFCKDEQPVLGQAPGWQNIFISTGHGPSGLQLGPVSSAAVVDLMLGQTPRFDLVPFSAARF